MNNIKVPYFTICVPAYNRQHTLKRCLDSLCDQTYKNFEVIFVDDGSTDNTKDVVNQYENKMNIQYIKKENGGKHTALNIGIKKAGNSELFLILDSDDWLKSDALDKFRNTWESIPENKRKKLCGVAGKCKDQDGNILGALFPDSPYIFSYIDMHFKGVNYGDCCECTKTSIIKQYAFPEPPKTKFVPEYYIYDQIGVDYSLYCINEVILYKEYLQSGITNNINDYFEKNCIGYSYGIVCRIEKIFNKCPDIPLKEKIITWYEYWKTQYYDRYNLCDNVKKVTFSGKLGKMMFYVKYILVKFKLKGRI